MEQLFTSGRIADVVLVIMAAEAVLLLYLGRPWSGWGFAGLLGNLLAGASLVVALKIALIGGDWILVAFALIASLVGHLADVLSRLRSRRRA